jgi:EAL domain-containing protein (putative c-di-GMP-specific phosphodiesterase class I)
VKFIPLAEESGYIERLGQWAMAQACAQMAAWRAAGLPIEHVAVNVSPRQFRKRDLLAVVESSTREAQLPASCLEIEITEGLLLASGDAVEGMLRALSNAGHGIALDDFGTGFSSMSYLKRFPVTTIKIDRTFVDGLGAEEDSEAIVAAIIAMSHALGKKVIAEGVETDRQREVLKRLACDRIQGFVESAALAADDFQAFVVARSMAAMPA